jgi:SAM-dependent methyltransferase
MESELMHKLKSVFLKEQFNPSFLGLFINPFYFARKAIYDNIRSYASNIKGRILDVGCGTKPYEKLFDCDMYIGLDTINSGHKHEFSSIDIVYDGEHIPFEGNYFDSIVCFEVLEAIFEPKSFLKEVTRVLKPGGTALFTVPFIWDEHDQPYDFARYSSFGLKHLFEEQGFIVLKNRKYLDDPRIIFLLVNAYLHKVIQRIFPNRILSYLFILPLTSLNNLLGHISFIFPKNRDLYFGNIFLLKKT